MSTTPSKVVALEVHPRGLHPEVTFIDLKTREPITWPNGIMVIIPKDLWKEFSEKLAVEEG